MTVEDIQLPGDHNVENYLAAIAAVEGLVSDGTIRDFAQDFGGVEHRIELFRTRNGVRWYNDSIASSPSRTIAGLRAFGSQKVILIDGGKDKGISYEELGPVINSHVKLLLLCGATAGVIRRVTEQAANYSGLENSRTWRISAKPFLLRMGTASPGMWSSSLQPALPSTALLTSWSGDGPSRRSSTPWHK